MAKFACPKCKTPIEATPDLAVVECPTCGKKYKNPKYVAPAAPAEPAEEAAQQNTQEFESKPEVTPAPAPAPAPQPEPQPAPTPAPAPAPAYQVPAPVAYQEQPAAPAEPAPVKESKFTGKMISWLGHHLFNFFITLITLGIAYPWAVCRRYRWEISHKVIDGHKLTFEGKGISLLGHWLLWVLLTIVTIGIYGLWVPCKLQAWITERTHIE